MSVAEFLRPTGAAHLTNVLSMQRALVRLSWFDESVQQTPSGAGQVLKRMLDSCKPADRFVLASRPEFFRYVAARTTGTYSLADLELPLLVQAARRSGVDELEVALSSDLPRCRVVCGESEFRAVKPLSDPILRIGGGNVVVESEKTGAFVVVSCASSVPSPASRLVDGWPAFGSNFDDGNRPLLLSDLERKYLDGVVTRALELVGELAGDAGTEMTVTATYLSPIVANVDDGTIPSFSSSSFPGVIFVGLLGPAGQTTDWRHLAELIFHEHLHNRLYLLDELLPLTEESARSADVFYSPWKGVERPLEGMIHSLYVFSHLAWFWGCALRTSTASIVAEFATARCREHLRALSQVDHAAVSAARGLTEVGRAVVRAVVEVAEAAQEELTHAI